tara:strand:- start:273 stop:1049 length:777 start_codon:yes stop_codon:yes gene_type:complete
MNKKQTMPWYVKDGGFFGADYFEEYADILTLERTKAEVDFIEKELNLKKGVKILDLACGHGRHTIELAKRGYLMTGQDINSFFLNNAKRSAKKAGVNIRWIKGDMRQISFENEFDVVINLFTAFGYLESDEDDQKVLHQVSRALRPGGRFMIDFINRERIMRIYNKKDWLKFADETVVIIERNFDLVTGRNHERRTKIYKNGKKEVFNTSIRMYTLTELIGMCKKAGLQFVSVYGDYNREVPTIDSKRYIFITKKSNK